MTISQETIRAWWWHRQGLGMQLAGQGPDDVLQRTGWSRSVGGSGPYLALFARAGLSRQAVDEALASLSIHELPSARGCTYVVPAADYAVALRAGQGRGEAADMENAKKHCGVTDQEIDRLCQAVLDALDRGPLDPNGLKEAVGSAVRHLGEAGKKRGMTTTLPLALGRLQSLGEVRRVPVNGRIDQQRYRYARWRPSPLLGRSFSDQELAVELARNFFRWAGPATVKQLSWWAGLTVKAAKAAAQALALAPLGPDEDRLLPAEDFDALRSFRPPREPQYSLVGSLDNIAHLRRNVTDLLDEADQEQEVYAERGKAKVGGLSDLPHHAILDRGHLIGFWEFDGKERIVWQTFKKAPAGLAAEVARMETFVRDQLGDARSFSLDSPESRVPRLDSLRA